MSTIEKQVMATVRFIYVCRLATTRLAIECYVLVLSLLGIATLVSVPHVLENLWSVANHGLLGVGTFLFAAVLGTRVIVQIAVGIGALTFVMILLDLIRSLRLLARSQKSSLA